jgi:hypothetical protein
MALCKEPQEVGHIVEGSLDRLKSQLGHSHAIHAIHAVAHTVTPQDGRADTAQQAQLQGVQDILVPPFPISNSNDLEMMCVGVPESSGCYSIPILGHEPRFVITIKFRFHIFPSIPQLSTQSGTCMLVLKCTKCWDIRLLLLLPR